GTIDRRARSHPCVAPLARCIQSRFANLEKRNMTTRPLPAVSCSRSPVGTAVVPEQAGAPSHGRGRPMKQVIGGAVLLLACLAVPADDKPGDKPLSPRAQYDALVKEHQAEQQAYFKALPSSTTVEERQKSRKEAEAKLEKVQARF